MTNFDRAKIVLDQLTASANMPTAKFDAMVKAELSRLSTEYGRLLVASRQPVDYSGIATQTAYVYRCAASHGQWLYHALLAAHAKASKAFKRDVVKVAAIGGGPGSDLLGVMKYSGQMGLTSPTVHFKLLDHEPAWQQVWAEFVATYKGQRSIKYDFRRLDLAAGRPWTRSTKYVSADIFTLSFCLSEAWIFNGGGSVSNFLDQLISSAKPGALFVYVDNGGPSFNSRTEAHFARKDVKLVASSDDQRRLLGSDEQSSSVAAYKVRFGESPKLTGNVSYRVWERLA